MKLRFQRMLMQRFRSILHLVDSLMENGHDLCLTLGRQKYAPEKFYADPWKIHAADKNSMNYLVRNFGMKVKRIEKISWTKNKYAACDLLISNDTRGVNKNKTPKGLVTIPYMGFNCYTPKGKVVVGNPMCQEIRVRQASESEKKGKVLILHPGGGRDFLSPKRKKYPPQTVIDNNISLMNKTIAMLSEASEIVIKTHPAPYITCDKESVESKVLPHLSASCPVSVRDDDLIGLICQSEFIINYGSSTVIWLLGSPKKWANIIDQAKFNLKLKNRRDRIVRAENWWEWPQNVKLSELRSLLENYETKVNRSLPFMQQYYDFYKLNAINKCVELIEEFGS